MIEHTDARAGFGEIEEMVRAAGGYLDVSDDLRPRTLEEARHERRDSSTGAWIAILAAIFLFAAVYTSQSLGGFSLASPFDTSVSANAHQLMRTAAQRRTGHVYAHTSWTLVDSFSELRQRQASLLDDAF